MGILWKLEEYAAQRNANSAKKTANSIPLMHLRRLVNGKKRYFLWKPNMRIFIAHTGRYDLSLLECLVRGRRPPASRNAWSTP